MLGIPRYQGGERRNRVAPIEMLPGVVHTLLGNSPVTTTTKIFQKYCDTNGRRMAIQMGGVLRYKWEEY